MTKTNCKHTIELRAPTAEERKLIEKLCRPDLSAYLFIVILCGIGPLWLLGQLGYWLVAMASPELAGYGRLAGWAAALLMLGYMLALYIPHERRMCQIASRDRAANLIQDIHVTDPQVVEIALISNNAPILAFDIGGKKILFLQGQWMYQTGVYLPGSTEDFNEDTFNGLSAPHSFPSSEFTISRFPNCGEVASIRVHGFYVPPQPEIDILKPEYVFHGSEVMHGDFDQLAEVLEAEHQRRIAT